MSLMEIHELDHTIKRALLYKTNEIQPSDETFIQILAGLEKQHAHRALIISYKHYLIALICAVSVILGTTLVVSIDARASAIEITNTVQSVLILDKSNKVVEGADKVFVKHALLLQTFAGCFLLNQVIDLKLCLRFLIIGRMTLGQAWYYNKSPHERVPLY